MYTVPLQSGDGEAFDLYKKVYQLIQSMPNKVIEFVLQEGQQGLWTKRQQSTSGCHEAKRSEIIEPPLRVGAA